MSRAVVEVRLREKLDKHVAQRAQELRNVIVETLSQPGQGKTYTHELRTFRGRVIPIAPREGGPHTASAPGDPPAVDSGQLRRSIRPEKVQELVHRVGTNVTYAPLLEFGTRKIAPRPYMRPSAARLRANL